MYVQLTAAETSTRHCKGRVYPFFAVYVHRKFLASHAYISLQCMYTPLSTGSTCTSLQCMYTPRCWRRLHFIRLQCMYTPSSGRVHFTAVGVSVHSIVLQCMYTSRYWCRRTLHVAAVYVHLTGRVHCIALRCMYTASSHGPLYSSVRTQLHPLRSVCTPQLACSVCTRHWRAVYVHPNSRIFHFSGLEQGAHAKPIIGSISFHFHLYHFILFYKKN